jgi:hypothetical protein
MGTKLLGHPVYDKSVYSFFFLSVLFYFIFFLQFHEITERIIKSCDFDVNLFLTEIDLSLERSRNIFRQFDNAHRVFSDEEWEMIQLKVNTSFLCLTKR